MFGEEEVTGTVGSCFLPGYSTSSFPDVLKQSQGYKEKQWQRGTRDGIRQVQGHAFQRSSPNRCPRDWPLGSTYLRPILCDRAKILKTFKTSKQKFRSVFPFKPCLQNGLPWPVMEDSLKGLLMVVEMVSVQNRVVPINTYNSVIYCGVYYCLFF